MAVHLLKHGQKRSGTLRNSVVRLPLDDEVEHSTEPLPTPDSIHYHRDGCQAADPRRCSIYPLRITVAQASVVDSEAVTSEGAPNLRPIDRIIASVCAGLMRPVRLVRSAIVLQPATLMSFHRALVNRKYRLLFAPRRRMSGPKGPSRELIAAIVEMKQRNPRFGCRRIAQQIAFRILCQSRPGSFAIERRHSGLLNRSQRDRSRQLQMPLSLPRVVSVACGA